MMRAWRVSSHTFNLIGAREPTYRDFHYVIPFMIQFWMFATPVVYPASLVPADSEVNPRRSRPIFR